MFCTYCNYRVIYWIPATLSLNCTPLSKYIYKFYISYILFTTIKILLREFRFPWNCRNLNSCMSWCITIRLVYGLENAFYEYSPLHKLHTFLQKLQYHTTVYINLLRFGCCNIRNIPATEIQNCYEGPNIITQQ